MARHRSRHGAFKRRDMPWQLVRSWAGKPEAAASDGDVQAADLIWEHGARIAALKRMAGRQASRSRPSC